MNENVIVQIVILALILEAIIQTLKPIWKPEERTVIYFVSLLIGQALSVAINYLADLDLFAAVGVPLVRAPVVGVILTGLLLSRGSGFIHDLYASAQNLKGALSTLTPNKR